MEVISLKQLVKTYEGGRVRAVDGLSLTIERGARFGLIGPDGAGKTSLLRMLATLLLPDSGQATVLGQDVVTGYRHIRKRTGYMPQRFSLYQDLSVEENLQFFATLFNTTVRENFELIRDIYEQLAPFSRRRAGQLSGGMKQKLALCCALVHRPDLLLLDEPTTGVDAVSRKEFWDILGRLKAAGITILVSTPYMDEALRCERIALMQDGRLLTVASPAEIISRFDGQLYAIRADDMSRLLKDLRGTALVGSCFSFGDTHHITFREDGAAAQAALLASLRERNHIGLELLPIQPTVEDCFIQLMH